MRSSLQTILIVEDHSDTLDMYSQCLAGPDRRILTSRDGAEALIMARLNKIDIAIIDLRLPIIDGFNVARSLRSDSRNGQAILVAHSGSGEESMVDQACDSGFDYFVLKPVELEVLQRIVVAPRQNNGMLMLSKAVLERSNRLMDRYYAHRSRSARRQAMSAIRGIMGEFW